MSKKRNIISTNQGQTGVRLITAVVITAVVVGGAMYAFVGGGGTEPSQPNGDEKRPIPEGSIKIGFPVVMSGGATAIVADQKEVVSLVEEYINEERDGILGREVEAVLMDTESSAKTAVDAAIRLVKDEGCQAIIGYFSSGCGTAVVHKIEEELKVPTLFQESTTTELFTELDPNPKWVFRVGPSDDMQGIVMAQTILKAAPDVDTIATLAPDYDWGKSVTDSLISAIKQRKSDVEVVYEAYHPVCQAGTDFTPYISKIMSKNPDVLAINSFGTDTISLVTQGRAQGMFEKLGPSNIFLCDGNGTPTGLMTVEGQIKAGTWAIDRTRNSLYPPTELGYPNKKINQMWLDELNRLPAYFDIHLVNGLLYLEKAYEQTYKVLGEYPTKEQVANSLEWSSIVGVDGLQMMWDHQNIPHTLGMGQVLPADHPDNPYPHPILENYYSPLPETMKRPMWMDLDEFHKIMGEWWQEQHPELVD